MMIAISTLTIDPLGDHLLIVKPGAVDLGGTTRRVSRIATLDGGAYIQDGGSTVADKTIVIDLTDQTKTTIDALKYLCQQYPIVILLTEDGAFRAAPERVSLSSNRASMSLLVVGVGEIKL
jgi:hypothetical protein